MSFPFFAKKNNNKINVCIGCFILLLVLLSQSKFLTFLFETTLGRFFLFLLIVVFSSIHYILGIVTVLILIIAFNTTISTNPMYYEGMTSSSSTASVTKSNTERETETEKEKKEKENEKENEIEKGKIATISHSITKDDVSSNNTINKPITETSKEGFDLIGTESKLKRGKQSNSINVMSVSKNSENISPYEEHGAFSIF